MVATVRAGDFWGLTRAMAPASVLACEGGPDAEALARGAGADLHTLDDRDGVREVWGEMHLEDLALLPRPGGAVVVAYSASAALERAAGVARLLAVPAALKRRLDDKIAVRAMLGAAGIPVPRCEVALPEGVRGGEPGRRLGYPLVVQRRTGSLGLGTAIVPGPSELGDATAGLAADEPLLVSAYAGATTLNAHGVAYDGGVRADPPSVQATGIAGLGGHSATYCGNDFAAAAALPAAVRDGARDLVRRAGEVVAALGHRGGFGVDVALADDGSRRVIEVNARLQGSTGLLSELQEGAGGAPVDLRHALALLGDAAPADEEPDPETGAMFVLRRDDGGVRPAATAAAGVLVRGRPGRGVRVVPGAVLGRAFAPGPLVEPDGRRLTPAGAAAVAALREAPLPG